MHRLWERKKQRIRIKYFIIWREKKTLKENLVCISGFCLRLFHTKIQCENDGQKENWKSVFFFFTLALACHCN